jgi:uncharacterized protein (TIGR03067 family)
MGNTDASSPSEAIAKEMEKFQGTWRQVAHERDGVVDPLDERGWEPRVTFSGDTFVVTLADGSTAIKGTFKLDPTQEPKAVDWMDTFGPDAGKIFLAIYSLEGDRLVFCAAEDGQARPTEFRAGPGQDLRVNEREVPGGGREKGSPGLSWRAGSGNGDTVNA